MIVNDSILNTLPSKVAQSYRHWITYMHENIDFSLKTSPIHTKSHAERVLLYALLIAYEMRNELPQDAPTMLAHAAIFHDTRRFDDWLDVGHGGRAATYYREYSEKHDEVVFYPETHLAIAYHDRDDDMGVEAINEYFGEDASHAVLIYQIFKDADALDRFRLGEFEFDIRYIRTKVAKNLVGFARNLVEETVTLL